MAKINMRKTRFSTLAFSVLFLFSVVGSSLVFTESVHAERDIVFPVIGESTYSNDFYAARGTRRHNAIDIIADKGQLLVAAVKGTIIDVQYPQPSWGYSVTIMDDEGWRYTYIHMNDDTPGTNDGDGGGMNAYAADVREGNRVARGQLIGRVGDSGHSNGVPHLHFEMRQPNGNISNPFQSLRHATRISKPRIPGRVTDEILPFSQSKPGANIAMGNFDSDPASEFVVGAGQGGGPHVKVYDDTEAYAGGFFAYDSGFRGGVDVAAGDIDGDGTDEIITVPLVGGPHIKVYEPDGTPVLGFFAFDSSLRHGLKVTAGDTTGDDQDEIIVGMGPGGEPLVRVFDLPSGEPGAIHTFHAYRPTFLGGVDVAAGNVIDGSAFDEIVTAAGPTGSPQVRVLTANGTGLADFRAYADSMKGGVRVSIGDVDPDTSVEELLTLPASNAFPHLKMFTGNGSVVDSTYFIEQWWIGGYDVAAGSAMSKAVTGGNRRVSIRDGIN